LDFNARIGLNSHQTSPKIIGNNTFYDETNENGERLCSKLFAHHLPSNGQHKCSFHSQKEGSGLG